MRRKSSKKCCYYKELIQRRLDGDISAEENEELNGHLAECDGCREEFVSFASLQNMMAKTRDDEVEVPEGFFEKLAERLEKEASSRRFVWSFEFGKFANARSLSLVAASVTLVVLVVGVISSIGTRDKVGFSVVNHEMRGAHVVIYTNGGRPLVLPGDEGDPDRYKAALDELERQYLESLRREGSAGSEGYIRTSWGGSESSSPIH